MANMNPIDVAEIVFQAGFRSANGPVALAVIAAETGGAFDPDLEFDNTRINPSTGKPYGLGIDHGLWMINDHWHPEVTHEEAHDPLASSKEAFRISGASDGTPSFGQWNTYKNKLHEKYLPLTRVAWEAAKRIRLRDAQLAAKDLSIVSYKEQIADANADILRMADVIEVAGARANQLEAGLAAERGQREYLETYLKTVHDRLHAKADEIMTAP